MTKTTEMCCLKCENGTGEGAYALGIARPYCLNKQCACHSVASETTDTWEERFDERFGVINGDTIPFSEQYSADDHKDFIRTEIALARQEEAKAYGGCTNCYGKGYSTRKASWEGHGEHDIGTGDVHVSYPAEFYMPCTKCNRGTQFASAMKSTRQEGEKAGRETFHEILRNAFHGSLHLPHRCVACGKPSKSTWEEMINSNAIGAKCVACATQNLSTGS